VSESPVTSNSKDAAVLLFSVLIISICALTYELLISTTSAYFLGSSVFHFSVTIGLFMTFLGAGSFCSKFVEEPLIEKFIFIEILLGLIGGVSAAILYICFATTEWYYPVSVIFIATISFLVGLEIPIVSRMLQQHQRFKDLVAHIFTFDYAGALVASILFPLVLLPYFGLIQTAATMGIINLLVAYGVTAHFRVKSQISWRIASVVGICALSMLCYSSLNVTRFFESYLYEDQIVLSKQSQYQRIIVTRFKEDIRLFINGDLQFSSGDEYRYHETLVHPALSGVRNRENVLVLGGGDGLAVRELLKYQDVAKITLVDLDPEMTTLGQKFSLFRKLNQDSLLNAKVTIVNDDAWKFIEKSTEIFSAIVIDLPDPNDFALGKLYSKEFYSILKKRLAADGIVVTQSTSPYLSREAFWIINKTLREVFDFVVPYSTYVPSFGQWGFNLASNRKISLVSPLVPTRYLKAELLGALSTFDSDTDEVPGEVNRIDNQSLVTAYERSWNEAN